MHMNAGVSSEKEKVKESQFQRVTPSFNTHFGCRVGGVTPGVVILIVDFSSKLLFTGKFVILRKSDVLLIQQEFLSLCHIICIC